MSVELMYVCTNPDDIIPPIRQIASKKESNAKSSPEDENTAPQTKTKKVRRELPSTCPLLTFLVGVGISWHLTIRFRL